MLKIVQLLTRKHCSFQVIRRADCKRNHMYKNIEIFKIIILK